MKTHIKYNSVNYNVNENKRTVACVMTVSIMGISFRTVGISVCSKDDTFNAETGKRIAESRAKAQVYVQARKNYMKMQSEMEKNTEFFKQLSAHCKVLQMKEKEHIKKLSNS